MIASLTGSRLDVNLPTASQTGGGQSLLTPTSRMTGGRHWPGFEAGDVFLGEGFVDKFEPLVRYWKEVSGGQVFQNGPRHRHVVQKAQRELVEWARPPLALQTPVAQRLSLTLEPESLEVSQVAVERADVPDLRPHPRWFSADGRVIISAGEHKSRFSQKGQVGLEGAYSSDHREVAQAKLSIFSQGDHHH